MTIADDQLAQFGILPLSSLLLAYTAKTGNLLYKCSYILCAVYGLMYVWPTFHEEINGPLALIL